MGAKDTFPSRLHSLTEANEVEPLFFFFSNERLSFLEQRQTTWCDPRAFIGKTMKMKCNTTNKTKKQNDSNVFHLTDFMNRTHP